MASSEERLRHVDLKIARARKHKSELESTLQTFLQNEPYKVAAKHDPETRKLIYYLDSVAPVPDELALITGDVIQNLVTSLDHLAYQLVCNDTHDNPPSPHSIYFPIAGSQKSYDSSKARKLNGANDGTIEAVDALKPYKGGNDRLWVLHKLNNIEKHRLLLTVGSQAGGLNLGQLMAGHVKDVFPAEAVEALQGMELYLNPADKGFPLKPGDKLYTGDVDEKPNPNQKFRFDIALHEPGVIEGAPLLNALNEFTQLVEEVVESLAPRFSEK